MDPLGKICMACMIRTYVRMYVIMHVCMCMHVSMPRNPNIACILYFTILSTLPYYTILDSTILYFSILKYTILYTMERTDSMPEFTLHLSRGELEGLIGRGRGWISLPRP